MALPRLMLALLLVLGAAAVAWAAEPSSSPQLDKAVVSFRIMAPQWQSESRYRELLACFEKHQGVTDEITFFTSRTICPLHLQEMEARCRVLADRMAEARKLGYRAGVNVTATLGHGEEDFPVVLTGDYTLLTNIQGGTVRGCFCPNDPHFQEYLRAAYQLVARANPDYIWIDDDARLVGHMGVGQGCFCDRCLALFAEESGQKHTRASLQQALSEGTVEKRMAARKAWLAHNRTTMERLLGGIAKAVHEVQPKLPLGMMTGDRFFEGYDFARWAEVLAGPEHAPVYWRPGGGFYTDMHTMDMVGKSHDLGRQVSALPSSVLSIQSEIENFPFHRLQKSAHITALEAASHLGCGCTGAAFSVLSGSDEPLDEFVPIVAQIQKTRPFYNLLAQHLGRTNPVGVFAAWSPESVLGANLAGGDWFTANPAGYLSDAMRIFEIGLPAAYRPDTAAVTLLFPQSIATMSDEEITRVLSSGVYMDTETLGLLNERGFQELTGLAVERTLWAGCIEEQTAHPLNGPFAGRQRDTVQAYLRMPGHVLKKVDPKAETLARLVSYEGKEMAPTTMAVFENRLGGRVCVGGHAPWLLLESLSKSSQMKSVLRWLSHDRLPAYVASYHKTNLWVRQPQEGQLAIALLNASFDPAEQLTLNLRTTADTLTVYDMNAQEQTVRASGNDGPYRRFTLPTVEPWTMRLIVTQK